MSFLEHLGDSITLGFPAVLFAVLLLILAFVAANLAKALVIKVLNKVGAEEKLAKTGIQDAKTGRSTDFIGQLVFLIVFLLFLPAVLDKLGMNSVSQPITNAVNTVIGFIPKLFVAGIILFIGIYVAGVVRDLVRGLLNGLGLNKLQEKLGVKAVENQNTFSEVLAGIVYVLILIPVIVAALEVLGLTTIAQPVQQILNQIMAYIPIIFVAAILLVLGYQLSKLLAPLLENLLSGLGLDRVAEGLPVKTPSGFSLSRLIAEIVRWIILVVFFVEAVNVLNLSVLTGIGTAIIRYLPLVLSAVIILGGGFLLASWIESIILKSAPNKKPLALAAKILILVVAGFMTLSQLGFAENIVHIAFIIILAGLAVAFAVSFGIGGRKFAEKRLEKLEKKLDNEEQ